MNTLGNKYLQIMYLPSCKTVAQNDRSAGEEGRRKMITPDVVVVKEAIADTAGRTSGGLCHSTHSPSSLCACFRGWWKQQKMQI